MIILNEISEELKEEYISVLLKIEQECIEDSKTPEYPAHAILELINKLKALSIIIRKTSFKKDFLELEQEQRLIQYKREAMANGMKSTEAKEYAKTQTVEAQKVLIRLERDIELLKDLRKTVEKELKFRYLEYESVIKLGE